MSIWIKIKNVGSVVNVWIKVGGKYRDIYVLRHFVSVVAELSMAITVFKEG